MKKRLFNKINAGAVYCVAIFSVTSLSFGSTAFAADSDGAEIERMLEAGASVNGSQGEEEILPEIGEDVLARFKLQRGYYVSSDLGVFETIGGVEGVSNLQPFMAIRLGMDVSDVLSVQFNISQGFSSGNPHSAGDGINAPASSNFTKDYGLLNMGVEAVATMRIFNRVALEPMLGAGFTRIAPALSTTDGLGRLSQNSAHVVGGLAIKYLTLLTGFNAGFSVNAYYIVGPGIIGISESFLVRYTF